MGVRVQVPPSAPRMENNGPLTNEALGIKASSITISQKSDSINPYYALAKHLELDSKLLLLIKHGNGETEEAEAIREEMEVYWYGALKNKITEAKMKELHNWLFEEINPYNESER